MKPRALAPALLAAGALAVALCACAPDAGVEGAPNSRPGRGVVEAPSFDGPWAGLFATTWEESTEVEREALADGEIDDLEYAYFRSEIVDCMEGLGSDARWDADGSLSYGNNDDLDPDDVTDCMRDSGLRIVALKDSMTATPTTSTRTRSWPRACVVPASSPRAIPPRISEPSATSRRSSPPTGSTPAMRRRWNSRADVAGG